MVYVIALSVEELDRIDTDLRIKQSFTKTVAVPSLPRNQTPRITLIVTRSSADSDQCPLFWLGVVRRPRGEKVAAVDSRITVELVRECPVQVLMRSFLDSVPLRLRHALVRALSGEVTVLGDGNSEDVLEALARQHDLLRRTLDFLGEATEPDPFDPRRVEDRSWQEQYDMTRLGLAIGNIPPARLAAWRRPSDPDAPYLAGLIPEPFQQGLIENDARHIDFGADVFTEAGWPSGSRATGASSAVTSRSSNTSGAPTFYTQSGGLAKWRPQGTLVPRADQTRRLLMAMGQKSEAHAPIVGNFHVARQSGGRPLASSTWRVVTKHHSVVAAIADHFAGSQVGKDALEGDDVEILTGHERIPILLDGREAVSFRMVSQGASETFHVCDGVEYLEPESSRGRPCGCPHALRERKAAAATGRGPRPEVQLRFRLAELPDLGMFGLRTGSWEVVEELPGLKRALCAAEGPVECGLRYAFVGFTTLSGVDVSYRRPNIELGESPRLGKSSVQLSA